MGGKGCVEVAMNGMEEVKRPRGGGGEGGEGLGGGESNLKVFGGFLLD